MLWTVAGGVPRSLGIVDSAQAAEPSGMTFLQISDSHIGFDKAANPNALGALEEAIGKINAMPAKPSTDDGFSFTFTAAGDYKYFCSLHPHMTGIIRVE